MTAEIAVSTPIDDVSERIREAYPDLSDAMKKFADFVLDNPFEASRMSIHAAVASVGVSVATAHRFVIRIGYTGYTEFRDALFETFRKDYTAGDSLRESGTRFEMAYDVFRAEMHGTMNNIQTTLQRIPPEAVEEAADRIVKARRVFVVGTHSSSYLAALLSSGIQQFCGNASSSSSTHGAVGSSQHLFRYDEDDLVIAIAFPRYYRDTIELARFVAERSVPLIAITDGPRSPLSSISDLQFHVRARRVSTGLISDAAVLALMEALIAAVAFRVPDAAEIELAYSKFAMPWFERS